jgi:hypothetical protein
LHLSVGVNKPNTIVLQPPERILRVMGPSRGSELLEELLQVAFGLLERDFVSVSARPTRESV